MTHILGVDIDPIFAPKTNPAFGCFPIQEFRTPKPVLPDGKTLPPKKCIGTLERPAGFFRIISKTTLEEQIFPIFFWKASCDEGFIFNYGVVYLSKH